MVPLFSVDAIQFVERYLTKTDRVFEYGCGFSTVWLAKRVGAIISVETAAFGTTASALCCHRAPSCSLLIQKTQKGTLPSKAIT